jgi:hypothetical protein
MIKKILYSLTILMTAIIVYSCGSSINVLNKWAGTNAATIKEKNILVIARTADEKVRVAFEDEITKQLIEKGLKATASYLKHPNLKPNAKIDSTKKAEIVAVLEKEGYNAVVLSVLKDKLTNVKSTEEGGYYAGESLASYFPAVIPVYSYGFYGCYYSPMSYAYNPRTYDSYGTYVPETVETETSLSYVLESFAYNLDLPEDKQLLAYVTTRIDEPDNVHTAAKGYAKAIVDSFEKK